MKKHLFLILIISLLFNAYLVYSFQEDPVRENAGNAIEEALAENSPKGSPSPTELFTARHYFLVTQVIDGDTIEINYRGELTQVRLLGVDTPEIVTYPIQCYGAEATLYLKKLVDGEYVFLLPDLNNTDRDVYGRLLAYVYLEDGRQINALLLENGYGRLYEHFRLAYSQYYQALESEAKSNMKGVWNCTE